MIKLWIGFILLILLAGILVMLISEGHEYKCQLPNGGYLVIRWNEKHRKIELLKWQPQGKASLPPENIIKIHEEKKGDGEEEEKEPEKTLRWKAKGKPKPPPENIIKIHKED
ncbi:MAG: hypothetical protein GY853_08395 [PVC group bacterium]|nr:hypothetical protein [PVC group bacterium]